MATEHPSNPMAHTHIQLVSIPALRSIDRCTLLTSMLQDMALPPQKSIPLLRTLRTVGTPSRRTLASHDVQLGKNIDVARARTDTPPSKMPPSLNNASGFGDS
jgi:hypothetical protein